jgi:dUTP pyrophosphatase
MKIRLKRIDKTLPLPVYETKGAAGFDLLARETLTIHPHEIALIPGNIIVEVPKGFVLIIASRSSTPKKKGIKFPHSIGVIDQDYCGEEDEIKIQVMNFKDYPVTIERGEKIAQGLFLRCEQFEWEEVDQMNNHTRGGFGSTGGINHHQ